MMDADLVELDRLLAARTQDGPLSWAPIGEKVNGFVIGWACTPDDTPVQGRIEDRDDIVDDLVYKGELGEHEAATCNYADPDILCWLWNHAPALVAEVRRLREVVRLAELLRRDPWDNDRRDRLKNAIADLMPAPGTNG